MVARDILGGAVIFCIWGLAALLSRITELPLPTGVIGLLLLTGALFSGIIPLSLIQRAADFLLKHMILFFIPAVVGVVSYTEQLKHYWLLLVVAMVIPLIGVLLATAFVAKYVPPTGEQPKESISPR